jgi:TatD DNase family protein
MIDTHAHLYDQHFLENLEFHIGDIRSKGVQEVWLPNCDLKSWNDLYNVVSLYPNFALPMLGLHPTYVKADYLVELQDLKVILDKHKVLAIGEIGLDYYWDTSFVTEQNKAFETQCHWALEKGIWIDIHCRKAYADLIKIIKKKEFEDVYGIVHCFSGDAREARTLVDLGFKLGIGGVITYKNSNLFEDIRGISIDNIVLETDSPYLSPVPYRGQPNSPGHIPLIAQKLADLYQISINELVQKTTTTALMLKANSGF